MNLQILSLGLFLLLSCTPFCSSAPEEPSDELLEIIQNTEQIRQLVFLESPQFETLSKETMTERIQKELSRQYSHEEWGKIESVFKLLGILPEDYDLQSGFHALLSEQVAGLYDPHEKKLFIAGGLSLKFGLTQIILQHELTHALTDQHFDLLKLPIEDTQNDDRALAAMALVEGDATLSMMEYAYKLSPLNAVLTMILSVFVDQETFNKTPLFLQTWMVFPYLAGETFLLDVSQRYLVEDGKLLRRGKSHRLKPGKIDWEVVNFIYHHPPQSTEQILHPQKYHPDPDHPTEMVIKSEELLFDGTSYVPVWENTLGEFGIRSFLISHLPSSEAMEAAEGWDGDRYALLESHGGHHSILWKTIWDTVEDREEFELACNSIKENHLLLNKTMDIHSKPNQPLELTLWIKEELSGKNEAGRDQPK